ncbi:MULTISPECIES: DUF3313 domain-containing protein [Pantoea]|uniref:DUF3313 domain-containing protein n=1 Tax=Candidatus Pantoea floridensis TaxID=1938870 RepID=A0A286BNS5_9GAMM|nr:DUF3313 domain-containing protein [Pantoea floridensis]PIF22717.1 uncharacterized protein DUF3313 [Enterobacteriaceae bacterium JKS000233]SOD35811.1 Protein of unknown function [Pantoea floridensis]HBZ16333.1 DUF3313 domain-containing protein [Pantoea sp.]
MRFSLSVPVLTLALLAAGCTSHVADKKQYSGFLGDYSQLQSAQSPSGKPTLRWVSPDYHDADYRGVVYTPVVYYPVPHPTERVSQQTLDQIRAYTDSQLKRAISERKPLVAQKGPHTLVVKTAITAVSAENEGMQFYEVVPIAAVVASTMAATGHRTQESALFLEVEAIDGQTGKPLIKVVRKAFGKPLPNSSAPITLNDLRPGIDEMVRDVVAFSAP